MCAPSLFATSVPAKSGTRILPHRTAEAALNGASNMCQATPIPYDGKGGGWGEWWTHLLSKNIYTAAHTPGLTRPRRNSGRRAICSAVQRPEEGAGKLEEELGSAAGITGSQNPGGASSSSSSLPPALGVGGTDLVGELELEGERRSDA